MSHTSNNRNTGARSYPLGSHAADIKAKSGRSLDTINLAAATLGELSASDIQIGADTLRAQADIASAAGYVELAQNLRRAAELTAVPNDELLRMYELLRPHRATYDELLAMAARLITEFQAPLTAEFVREAADVYRTRNLVRK